jgi:hypothetical protein
MLLRVNLICSLFSHLTSSHSRDQKQRLLHLRKKTQHRQQHLQICFQLEIKRKSSRKTREPEERELDLREKLEMSRKTRGKHEQGTKPKGKREMQQGWMMNEWMDGWMDG